ncbi:hypothetical protein JCM19237_3818 [Photobacterium aphoticum]|uniref:Uncharacterized protein n=1 Tax=Photobacterium aphoticum TaxID=754436 RepID=A0A090RGR7_9GAMM|nr:hypothetical protein JCM19237_3818 [Photobacterium aphoticum]
MWRYFAQGQPSVDPDKKLAFDAGFFVPQEWESPNVRL